MIMNQVKNEREARAIYDKINKVAKANIGPNLDLKLIGKIDSDSKVAMSVKQRALFTINHPSSQPARDMEEIAASITSNLERNVLVNSNESGLTGLFKRLMEHF